jgi:PAS domain S-box-containing protein
MNLYRSALNALDQAVCLCEKSGRILFMNSAARRLTGLQDDLIRFDLSATTGRMEIGSRAILYSLSSLKDEGLPDVYLAVLKSLPDEIEGCDLRKGDRILAGEALASNQLLMTEENDLAISQAIEILGCSTNVDRVYIFKNYDTENGQHRCKLSHDWKIDVERHEEGPIPLQDISYSDPVPWYDTLAKGMPIKGLARDQPEQARKILNGLGVLSYLIVPIFTKEGFWGFIGFDDRRTERIWTWSEVSVLMTIAGAIGGSIDRWQAQAALKESEEKYRELVESSSSIIIRVDIQGCIRFINRFGLQFFGYAKEDILGHNVAETIMPDEDNASSFLEKNLIKGKLDPDSYSTNVMRNRRCNGEIVWIAWTHRPVQNDQGDIIEVLCIGNDLTENKLSSEKLKKAVQDLRETRDYLESLLDHSNAPMIVWDSSFKITRFNHAFERLTGHRAEDVLGSHPDILFPETSRDTSLAYIEKTLYGEHWDAVEIPILRKDGEVRTVLWNSATIYDEEGKIVIATIAQGQDITERKRAQRQVIFQASLLDQVRNGIIATDLSGRIIYWNRFSEVLYQWTAEEVVGKSIAETVVPEDKCGLIEKIIEDIICYGYREIELPVRRKDGCQFMAFFAFSVLKDQNGQRMGFVGVSVDLTERKKVEQDLLIAKEHAESATRAKSEFLANMSHEIRTPMNAVIGLTGLLLNTNIDPEQRDYIETIRSSGDSLLAVISDILDFSKIEGGMLDIDCEPFDLSKCLEASLNMVSQAAARKRLNLSFEIERDVPDRLLGDPIRLKQILVNLLGNAIKFTETGEISVHVSSQPSIRPQNGKHEILFAVRDTGIGISKDRMSRLFQSFSQVDASTTRKYGGTGLGLVISKNLAELMGGRIWAESEPGKGSTFYFTVQAESSLITKLADKQDALQKTSFREDYKRDRHLSILLAEDNLINQKVAIRMLERLGYKAEIAANGQEAMEALKNHPYDVVLMDVQMPEMDGLEATRRIRSTPGRQPYIIAMTAHAMKGDREICLGAGMNDYVSKPVRMEELKAAIERSWRGD